MATKHLINPTVDDFGVGDIVRLNSATLRMTVDKIDLENEAGAIECVWFDDQMICERKPRPSGRG